VRRGLSAEELDRRGSAVTTDPAATSVLPPVSSTTQPGTPARPQRADLPAAPERQRTRPNEVGRAALAGLPVHEDGPALEHTAAMPIDRRAGRRRRWPLWLAAVLVVACGAFGGWWFTAGPGGSTVVPAVVGQPVAQAEGAMEQASLTVETVEEFSEGRARGVVLRVEPGAGSELGKESTVRLVVSKGKERYAVPKLVGARLGDAGAALSPLTLRLGDRSEAWSETVAKGVVISQDPAPGESVKRGTPVSVVVSKGREPIEVPTVTGAPFDAASAAITKAGLTVQRGEDVNSDSVPAGQVVSQSPDKGTLHRGDTVTVVVSKGPVMVPVPDVVDQQDAAAEKTLTDLGFKVDKQYPFGELFEKKVRAQDPAAGTPVPKGTTIHLTIV
jgi:serine/threonine-protein kinase